MKTLLKRAGWCSASFVIVANVAGCGKSGQGDAGGSQIKSQADAESRYKKQQSDPAYLKTQERRPTGAASRPGYPGASPGQ